MLADEQQGRGESADPLSPRLSHFAPRANRVIFLYMTGGVSHVDSFDPKPQLFADHGKTITVDNLQGQARGIQPVPQAAQLDVSSAAANAAPRSAISFLA